MADSPLARFGAQVPPFVARYLASWQPYRPFWNYEDGCIYKGCLDLAVATGDTRFDDFVLRAVSERVAADGTITGFDPNEFNIDNVNAGKALFPLFARTGEARFRKAIDNQHAQLERHPRTQSGNFWHKKIYPHQVWLDGLYMAQPFRCAYAQLAARPEIFDDVRRQFAHVREAMRDANTGLYYHGWDESRTERWSNPETGCSPCFWGRAMGWFVMALVDCCELSAAASPATHAMLAEMLRETSEALLRVRSTRGLWYQVLDQGCRPDDYEETSATLMIAYAFMKGARHGILPPALGATGLESLQACIDRFLTKEYLHGICGVAGLGNVPYRDGSYEYYLSEPVVMNDPKGVGALFMALSEALQVPASFLGSRSPT
ncbi:MAG TPA: glycoside hydrolase family 88 protein [Steroidobacteraceae bacterium]|jgi:unsaturated rhamnogalacturonyl hydrolase|nr:glycoside hydrolase family 88 protein [Steroidobacteraceae bacterium]